MGLSKIFLAAMLAVVVCTTIAPAAHAASTVVDSYCSPSGDYCTLILKKADGSIVFSIRAFANYFGQATACVKKETRACHSTAPRKHNGLEYPALRQLPERGTGRVQGALARYRREPHRSDALLPAGLVHTRSLHHCALSEAEPMAV